MDTDHIQEKPPITFPRWAASCMCTYPRIERLAMGKLAATAKLPVKGCKLGRILDKHADDADREMLADLFDSSKGSAAIAMDVNNAYDLTGDDRVGKETVRSHREKACPCGPA